MDTHRHIVPGHAPEVSLAQFVILPAFNVLKVHNTIVIKILAWPHLVAYVGRVDVGERVLVVIPSSEAEIKTTNESDFVINDNKLFMMSPVPSHVAREFVSKR